MVENGRTRKGVTHDGCSSCALGTARPEQTIEQPAAAEVARTFVFGPEAATRALPSLFRRTQVHRRASVLLEPPNGSGVRQTFYARAATHNDRGPDTATRMQRYAYEAPRLAAAAARKALAELAEPPEGISHLVTVSCTGFAAPGIDVLLIEELGLAPTVGRVQVGFMGCHGALNALRVARAMVEADHSARVLVCAVELCSLHYQYGLDPQAVVANALFADGAAAVVVGWEDDPPGGAWQLDAVGSYLIPQSREEMTWRIGDHGFEMTLSARVPELIERHLRAWLESWLAANELGLSGVGCWAVHPGGPRILTSVAAALGLSAGEMDSSAQILAECGNMSSPTILFVIERLRAAGLRPPCLALGFGPGLMAEAALLR